MLPQKGIARTWILVERGIYLAPSQEIQIGVEYFNRV
jgi:hypothetical protein